jgi:hypothetical protein
MLTFTAFDLLDACREPGCPICRLEDRYVKSYIQHLFDESVNDLDLRRKLRLNRGFCAEHAWLAADEKLGDRLGFALIYKDVINDTLRQLKKELKTPSRGWRKLLGIIPYRKITLMDGAADALTPRAGCPACQAREKALCIMVSAIVEKGSARKMLPALVKSEGLCFPHLRSVLQASKNTNLCQELITLHLEKWNSVHKHLGEIIRKSDYRFADEVPGKEAGAWRRAVEIASGRKSR